MPNKLAFLAGLLNGMGIIGLAITSFYRDNPVPLDLRKLQNSQYEINQTPNNQPEKDYLSPRVLTKSSKQYNTN